MRGWPMDMLHMMGLAVSVVQLSSAQLCVLIVSCMLMGAGREFWCVSEGPSPVTQLSIPARRADQRRTVSKAGSKTARPVFTRVALACSQENT
jgi:hypothetical protein